MDKSNVKHLKEGVNLKKIVVFELDIQQKEYKS